MTTAETARVLEYLKTCYPSAWKDINEKRMVAVWADQFSDTDYGLVTAAVKAFVATDHSGYVPSIGQIKHQINLFHDFGDPTPTEAWNHIRQAISRSAYYSDTEFAKLTEIEQRLVGSPRQLFDWSQMDADTVDSVVASNVQRGFTAIMQRRQYEQALPSAVKERLKQLSDSLVKRIE